MLFLEHLVQFGVVDDIIIKIVQVLGAGGREEEMGGGV